MHKWIAILGGILVIGITIGIVVFPSGKQSERIPLEEVLQEYKYSAPYKVDEFDCSQRSALLERFLEKKGYKAYIAVSQKDWGDFKENYYHVWVLVDYKGWLQPIETSGKECEGYDSCDEVIGGFPENISRYSEFLTIWDDVNSILRYFPNLESEYQTNETIIKKESANK